MSELEFFKLTHPELYKRFCEMGKAWQDGYNKGHKQYQYSSRK